MGAAKWPFPRACPTSNRRIGNIQHAAHHPLHRFLANDLAFVVASDDPGIFDTTLAEELDWVVKETEMASDQAADLAERNWRFRREVLSGRLSGAS